jgi:hypothetical protein
MGKPGMFLVEPKPLQLQRPPSLLAGDEELIFALEEGANPDGGFQSKKE